MTLLPYGIVCDKFNFVDLNQEKNKLNIMIFLSRGKKSSNYVIRIYLLLLTKFVIIFYFPEIFPQFLDLNLEHINYLNIE